MYLRPYGSKKDIKKQQQQQQKKLKFLKNIVSSVDDSINHAIDFEISEKYQWLNHWTLLKCYLKVTSQVDSQVHGVSKNNKGTVKKQHQVEMSILSRKKWIMKEQNRRYQEKNAHLL